MLSLASSLGLWCIPQHPLVDMAQTMDFNLLPNQHHHSTVSTHNYFSTQFNSTSSNEREQYCHEGSPNLFLTNCICCIQRNVDESIKRSKSTSDVSSLFSCSSPQLASQQWYTLQETTIIFTIYPLPISVTELRYHDPNRVFAATKLSTVHI